MLLLGAIIKLLVSDQEGLCSQHEGKATAIARDSNYYCCCYVCQVEGVFFANSHLQKLIFDELHHYASNKGLK